MNKAIEEINSEISKVHELFDIAYKYNQKDPTRTELSQKCTTYLLDIWQTMGAIVDDISLLFDGMTNGEVIEALFPNATFKDAFIDTFAEITFVGSGYALLKKEWLESPYKRGDK